MIAETSLGRPCICLADRLVHQLQEKIVLAGEVPVDRAFGQASFRCHLVEARRLKTFLFRKASRGQKEPRPRVKVFRSLGEADSRGEFPQSLPASHVPPDGRPVDTRQTGNVGKRELLWRPYFR